MTKPIAIVDINDNIIGEKDKDQVYKDGDIFRIAVIMLHNKSGKYLVQRRSHQKSFAPLKWDFAAVAGHCDAGENCDETAIRELKEELNVENVELKLITKYYKCDDDKHRAKRFVYLYEGIIENDTALTLQEGEVEEVKWVSFEELKDWFTSNTYEFVPTTEQTFRTWICYKDNSPKVAAVYQFKNDLEDLKIFQSKAEAEGADIIEIRVDYVDPENFSLNDLIRLREILDMPAILTIRSLSEGGINDFSLKLKKELWQIAFSLGFEFIDIELDTVMRNELDLLHMKKNSSTKVILSYHNFHEDESLGDLKNFRNEMYELGADIAKLVVTYKSEESNETIFKLIQDTTALGKDIIAIAMGEKGRITRLEGLKLGSFLTFASLEGMSTAPGQCSVAEVKRYLATKDY